jgi:hypothetical protein
MRKATTSSFIEKAKTIHGDLYSYDKVDYIGSFIKVEIFYNNCKKYFFQRPSDHLDGYGCINCRKVKTTNVKIKKYSKKF